MSICVLSSQASRTTTTTRSTQTGLSKGIVYNTLILSLLEETSCRPSSNGAAVSAPLRRRDHGDERRTNFEIVLATLILANSTATTSTSNTIIICTQRQLHTLWHYNLASKAVAAANACCAAAGSTSTGSGCSPRTSTPGSAPVGSPSRDTSTPATIVCR